jgi:RNA polymerase sigma-70 factor (ECF subfamily)
MTTIEAVYERHARDVYRFAFWLCGDRHEAEDIVSETFVRLWAGADDLRARTVKAYLFTIARNLFLQRARRTRRERGLDEQMAAPSPAPDAQAEANDELRAVARALQKLPEVDRSALLLRAQDGLPYEEIAGCLGISVSAAKVKVHRARLKLSALRAR